MKNLLTCIVFCLALSAAAISTADVTDFTETFDSSSSGWRGFDAAGNDALDLVVSGGPDGSSYVSFEFNFQDFPDGSGMGGGQPSLVLFRGHDSFDSSGDAFVGDWLSDGVESLSFSFRHDLPVPATVFARFASSSNFPGALALEFAPAFPGQWTDVAIDIDASNPQFISFEGSDFNSVFSSIGNIQFGISVPAGFGGTSDNYRFDLDNVSVSTVPEPTFGCIAVIAAASFVSRRKR